MEKQNIISASDFRSGNIPGTKKGKKFTPGIREDVLQIQFTSFMKAQYPDVLHIHVANERRGLNKRQGANGKWFSAEGNKLKRKGVKPGVPDNLIFERSEAAPGTDLQLVPAIGLAIELKIKPNKPSPEQILFLEELKKRGWVTDVCYTFEAAEARVRNYFANRRKKNHITYVLPSDRNANLKQ